MMIYDDNGSELYDLITNMSSPNIDDVLWDRYVKTLPSKYVMELSEDDDIYPVLFHFIKQDLPHIIMSINSI